MPIYLMMVVMGIGYGVGYSLFYGALTDTYRFTTLELGLMSTASSLAWALGSIPSGKLSERFGARAGVMISTASALTTVVGFILFRSFPAFLHLQRLQRPRPMLLDPKLDQHNRG